MSIKANYTKNVIILILSHGLILAVGLLVYSLLFPNISAKWTEKRFSGKYTFINPLLECEVSEIGQNHTFNTLKKNLTNFVKSQSKNNSRLSIYIRDLNNGPWLGIEEKELFSPASLIKVPLMITYLKAAQSDPQLLQKEIVYTPINSNHQTIEPTANLIPDKKYTVWQLIEHMIIYSDNQAYDTLFEAIDNQLIQSTYLDIGIDIKEWFKNPSGNIIDVKTYASFFRILFNASYLSEDSSEKALKLLSLTTFNQGLTAKLPPKTVVSHKFGERLYQETQERQIHDCGIVYIPNKPYLICVMSRGQDVNQLESIIQQVSLLTYQHLSQ